MSNQKTTVLLCDCAGTMQPDATSIESGCGVSCSKVYSDLCQSQADRAAHAMQQNSRVVVACGQEHERFLELAEDLGVAENVSAIDIRDRAGWSDQRTTGPKMAALVADALLPPPVVPSMDITSEGICLVIGPASVSMAAAKRLSDVLTVTCMVTDPSQDAAQDASGQYDLVAGSVRNASGSLGAFELEIDSFSQLQAAGRGLRTFGPPANDIASRCDVIVDLSGDAALFPAPHKRDGYVRADPRDPVGVERAIFDAAQMTGSFEKPFYIRFDGSLCAHSRAELPGCRRCLDLCPTSAISSAGETVSIDPLICAGCGACAAACPTGAASADDPPVQHIFTRLRVMAETYRKAGGVAPRVLIHDDHGAEMIRLSARFGRGLPADVIPLELPSLGAFGHAEMLAALGLCYAGVDILAGPRTEVDPIRFQIELAAAIAGEGGAGRLSLLELADPDALSDTLYAASPEPTSVEPILPLGGRRDVTRLAAIALHGGAPEEPIALPQSAPYGAIAIDTEKCTLCLACVSLCPPGALGDNPDRPEVNFREEACVQCGVCASACPETAITLVPQLDLSNGALSSRELNGEEPFCCIECDKPFGVKSTIDRITAKLEGVHSMFTNSDNVRLIQMCDDCRVKVQFRATDNPFQMGERPRVRTTQDYLDDQES